jgi:hypothetical protein
VTELSPGLDMNTVKKRLGTFPKLLHNDDLKIDWDDKVRLIETLTLLIWPLQRIKSMEYRFFSHFSRLEM